MPAEETGSFGQDRSAAGPAKADNRRAAIVYLVTCILVLGGLFLLTGLNKGSYYDSHPVEFEALSAQQYALISGLTEAETAQIKLDYLERADPPDIGVYGHHIVRGMGQEGADGSRRVFNYYLNHQTLADTLGLLRLKERLEKLPRDLLLVQISHPYYGTKLAIGNFREMPLGFYWRTALQDGGGLLETLGYLAEQHFFILAQRFDWKHVGYALINLAYGSCQIHGLYGGDRQVQEPEPMAVVALFEAYGLTFLSERLEAVNRIHCTVPEPEGFRFDGTYFGPPTPKEPFDSDARLIFKNSTGKTVWTGAVVEQIRAYVQEINRLAERNGRQAVFFIPPRLLKFVPNAGHEQADNLVVALGRDDIVVVDHRNDQRQALFGDGRHLNSTYLGELLAELANRELYPRR